MDMHMPGMDGQTATEHIREFEEQNGLPPVPIIALTGDTTEGFRGMCLAAGCSEYMPKPIDYPLLVQLCKNLIRCPEAE
jgi:CheY-like chemotaxis protein